MRINSKSIVYKITFSIGILLSITCAACNKPNANQGVALASPQIEQKIDSIISILSLEEKIQMLCGNTLFSSPGIKRLGIKDLTYTDGPFGIREEVDPKSWAPLGLTTDSATFFPTGSALAATWNPELAYLYGVGLGEESLSRGKDIHLGPAINITRTPLNGRTYEYLSEDPFLNSRLAVGYIKGVQSTGTASCVKHFAVNNQESQRSNINVEMNKRALYEIYLPAFKASIMEAGSYSIMAAYNKFDGYFCSENKYLLQDLLRDEWKFQGMVISDWGGTHSTVPAAINGLDVEMGTHRYFTPNMIDSVKNGKIPESVIDEKVRNILRVYFFTNSSAKNNHPGQGKVTTPEHQKIVYDVACQSIVLLKNSMKILPVDVTKNKNIVVIGENAIQKNAYGGFGASVKTSYEVSPLEGLQNRLGKTVQITYVPGYKSKFLSRFVPDNTPDDQLIKQAVAAASKADVVLLFAGNNREVETESFDRHSLDLPFGQDKLIKAVCEVNPRTVIVVVAGAPVNLHVADSSSNAILYSWFNGSEGGNALADVITGKINPSGKLPFTIPVKLDDSPAHALKTFPGKNTVKYEEGLLVGYRWFDYKNISPAYPFGFGLSYTQFEYKEMKSDKSVYNKKDTITLVVRIANTGKREGMETIQIYSGENEPTVLRPVRELKAFRKVNLPSGSESEVTFKIAATDLGWFDDNKMSWVLNSGTYQLSSGSSSRDLRKVISVRIK